MSVCCECCVLSGRGLCSEVITRSEESYRLWCVVMCDLRVETSRRRPWPNGGCRAKGKKNGVLKCTDLVSRKKFRRFKNVQIFHTYLESVFVWKMSAVCINETSDISFSFVQIKVKLNVSGFIKTAEKEMLCLRFRASLIYINICPTRCNTKQSIYHSASSLYKFRVSTTPIIRSTHNFNCSLRYCAATSFQRGQGHAGRRMINRLLCIASRWTIINIKK